MQRAGQGHTTPTGATLGRLATSTRKRNMVLIVTLSPVGAALLQIVVPGFTHGQGLGTFFCLGGCSPLLTLCCGLSLDLAGVLPFVNQPLYLARLGLRLGNAPGSRAANRHADGLAIQQTLKHVGRFACWCCAQTKAWGCGIP